MIRVLPGSGRPYPPRGYRTSTEGARTTPYPPGGNMLILSRIPCRVDRLLLAASCGLILAALPLHPAWGLDQARLQRDLGIMEDILTSLCRHGSPTPCQQVPVCRGLHVEGYGVVFMVATCLDGARAPQPPPADGSVADSSRQSSGGDKASSPEAAAGIGPGGKRALMVEFLTEYAAAIGQLGDGDRIAVIAVPSLDGCAGRAPTPVPLACPAVPDPQRLPALPALPMPGAQPWPPGGSPGLDPDIALAIMRLLRAPTPGDSVTARRPDRIAPAAGACPAHCGQGSGEPLPLQAAKADGCGRQSPALAASITRKQLDDHRRGRLSTDQLVDRIRFDQQDPVGPRSRSVDIMAGILERGLTHSQWREPRAAVAGAYQPGLGAFFVVDASRPEPAESQPWCDPVGAWPDSNRVSPADRVEGDLVDLLQTYGPTLRGMQDDDQVVIEVRLAPGPAAPATNGPGQPVSRVVARVKWRTLQVDAGARPDHQAFRKAVDLARF
jgi:hypothetical protein